MEVKFNLDSYHKRKYKVAIPLPELVAQTNSFSVKNRPGCVPTLIGSNPKELFLKYKVKCNLKNSDPSGHDVTIRFDLSKVTDKTNAKNLDVAVNCTCPAFLYWGGQWNAYQENALEGDPRPLLKAPTQRLDLRNGFYICKHIKAVSERILPSVQHNIIKILRERTVRQNQEKGIPENKSLRERQEKMRLRQEKIKKDKPNQDKIRKELEDAVARRDVIKRDEPATEEEKDRIESTPEEKIKAPALDDIPELDWLNETEPTAPTKPTKPSAPASNPFPKGMRPQKIGPFTQWDREQVKRMQREEQRRLQREQMKRLQKRWK